jgi:hypothetical protein
MSEYVEKLLAIKGIGPATAEKLMEHYPTEEELASDLGAGVQPTGDAEIDEALRDAFLFGATIEPEGPTEEEQPSEGFGPPADMGEPGVEPVDPEEEAPPAEEQPADEPEEEPEAEEAAPEPERQVMVRYDGVTDIQLNLPMCSLKLSGSNNHPFQIPESALECEEVDFLVRRLMLVVVE